MFRGGKLKNRAVIDTVTAERIGYVSDIEIDEHEGKITAIIVWRGGFFRRIIGGGEMMVPWTQIAAVSNEFVLIKTHFTDSGFLDRE